MKNGDDSSQIEGMLVTLKNSQHYYMVCGEMRQIGVVAKRLRKKARGKDSGRDNDARVMMEHFKTADNIFSLFVNQLQWGGEICRQYRSYRTKTIKFFAERNRSIDTLILERNKDLDRIREEKGSMTASAHDLPIYIAYSETESREIDIRKEMKQLAEEKTGNLYNINNLNASLFLYVPYEEVFAQFEKRFEGNHKMLKEHEYEAMTSVLLGAITSQQLSRMRTIGANTELNLRRLNKKNDKDWKALQRSLNSSRIRKGLRYASRYLRRENRKVEKEHDKFISGLEKELHSFRYDPQNPRKPEPNKPRYA